VPRRKLYHLKAVLLVIASVAICAGAVYWRVRFLVLQAAEWNVGGYAGELIQQDERLAADIDRTFASANASTFPRCSAQDMSLLRNLLFRSAFLKDLGRQENGILYCSTIAGAGLHVETKRPPDLVTANGYMIFHNNPLSASPGERAEIVQVGRTDAVISPRVFSAFDRVPMMASPAIVDRSGRNVLPTNTAAPLPADLVPDLQHPNQAEYRNGMVLYTACSATRQECVMTGEQIPIVFHDARALLLDWVISGGLVGALFGLTILYLNRKRTDLSSQLRRAIRDGVLSLEYQPLIDLDTGTIVGCEALTRWLDADGKEVRPDVFIGLAEDRGFVGEITRFAVKRTLAELGDVLRTRSEFHVSINITASDLSHPAFVETLDQAITASGVPASNIGLELTERSTADRGQLLRAIRLLRDRGFLICIDDFGTGYSSLSYLHELELDYVKIDRVFASTIGTASVLALILPQIMGLARQLGLRIVVEGVERPEQAAYLAERWPGIQVQGYFFSEPLVAERLIERLEAQDREGRNRSIPNTASQQSA